MWNPTDFFHDHIFVCLDVFDKYFQYKITLAGHMMALGHFLDLVYGFNETGYGIMGMEIQGNLNKGLDPEPQFFLIHYGMITFDKSGIFQLSDPFKGGSG